MVNRLNGRLDSLLATEKAAGETVEEAERKARGIRTAVPEQISAIEDEYRSEQEKYEKMALEKLDDELEELQAKLAEDLQKKKRKLDESASVLAPEALKLLRGAVERERG